MDIDEAIALVRAITGDDETDPTFSDEEIETLYNWTDSIYLTSAMLLERAAASEALTYKIIKTDDLSVDGVQGAKLLLERAKRLREQDAIDEGAANDFFDVVYPEECYLLEYQERRRPGAWPWAS